ncbi:ABC transporter permease [Paenibacillus cymbidii]|uniref:ABC transporter permease n=1 Tax=Paenibacillus cymbidii TaxID=1639034 RepID=UPI00108179E1|nr:ABC transporter permease subunit [Paenibacillus cymbidii]
MTKRRLSKDAIILLLIALPGLLHFAVFKYVPLTGNIIAFQNYNIFDGIWGSEWAGVEQFRKMFRYSEFYDILRNTVLLSLYSIVFGFPAPLALALLLNELRSLIWKRYMQTLLYLPHFLSWVIIGGIFINLLSQKGMLFSLLAQLTGKPMSLLTEPAYFRGILISIGIWKEVGWGMIIYLAALAGINPNLYEAAMVDGAGRWRRMFQITLPMLTPAIVVLFLLRIGSVLDNNVEQVLVFLNPLVRDVGEVIDTYVYRVGLLEARFSYTTAIGMFKSAVGLILVLSMNQLSKRLTGESIY